MTYRRPGTLLDVDEPGSAPHDVGFAQFFVNGPDAFGIRRKVSGVAGAKLIFHACVGDECGMSGHAARPVTSPRTTRHPKSRLPATGHGDCVGWIKARRRVCPKEMYRDIVTRNKRSLRTRFAKRDELAKFGPDRCRARTEIAVRVLQHANIHTEC